MLLSPLLSLLPSPTPVLLPPHLHTHTNTLAACITMTLIFVGSLYLLPQQIRRRHRDDPLHVKARFVSVATACLLSIR
jgi:hypothetical protein